ncbi:LPS assembly lipoprotein LptE [Thauera sp. 2A1]|uniref:LPS-assembly lipoprotein LptE n=1 Tax=Thauera sp. 2A1 TaxID=2570191 RepID=UPI0012908DD1|nr:LPS assembly lipoprotein LptE [Thauera sp. 2A1]KAI5913557.1 LPS assembly lipoprotein LptE [Thauera sp. 2A1]
MLEAPALPRRRLLLAGAGLFGLALGGCGFHLRGPQRMDFTTIHIGVSALSDFGAALRRQFATTETTRVVEDPAQAEVRLQILVDSRSREILSLTGRGTVREYQLIQRLRFQLLDKAGVAIVAPTELVARREYTFDDSQILGKEQEEALLYRDMQEDLIQQLMRRLATVRLKR